MNPTCSTCRFWFLIDGGGSECRRFPKQVVMKVWGDVSGEYPVFVSETKSAPFHYFPETHQDDWCGEHQHKTP